MGVGVGVGVGCTVLGFGAGASAGAAGVGVGDGKAVVLTGWRICGSVLDFAGAFTTTLCLAREADDGAAVEGTVGAGEGVTMRGAAAVLAAIRTPLLVGKLPKCTAAARCAGVSAAMRSI